MRYQPVEVCIECGEKPPMKRRRVCKSCYREKSNLQTRLSKERNKKEYICISGRREIPELYRELWDLNNIIAKECLLPSIISRRTEL